MLVGRSRRPTDDSPESSGTNKQRPVSAIWASLAICGAIFLCDDRRSARSGSHGRADHCLRERKRRKTMLTIEDVAAIPLFSALPAVDLERLARTSADLHLSSGEFAVHEGGEGALFVVLTGKIEVVKTFDGIERRLGWRIPGTIFGEVPLALGTPFPGGYRAVEPS